MGDAINFHSQIALEFQQKYAHSKDFQQRYFAWTEILKDLIKVDHKVLDLGCGSGILTSFLAPRCKQVVSVDGSETMLSILSSELDAKDIQNVKTINAKIPEVFDIIDGKFNLIIASSLIEYLEDTDLFLRKANQILDQNGKLIVSIPNSSSLFRKLEKTIYSLTKYPHYYSYVKFTSNEKSFDKVLRQHGFKTENITSYGCSYPFSSALKRLFGEKKSNNMLLFVASKNN